MLQLNKLYNIQIIFHSSIFSAKKGKAPFPVVYDE